MSNINTIAMILALLPDALEVAVTIQGAIMNFDLSDKTPEEIYAELEKMKEEGLPKLAFQSPVKE